MECMKHIFWMTYQELIVRDLITHIVQASMLITSPNPIINIHPG